MFKIDTETNAITLPQGDTLLFRVRINGPSFPEGTVGVFAICTKARNSQPVFSKVFPLKMDDGQKLDIRLTNAESRTLPVAEHRWDLRLVTDPEYDSEGNVRCDDDSDEVVSIFSGSSELPKFTVTSIAKAV